MHAEPSGTGPRPAGDGRNSRGLVEILLLLLLLTPYAAPLGVGRNSVVPKTHVDVPSNNLLKE